MSLLMEIPAGDVVAEVRGLKRVAYKIKERAVGYPRGPPPMPKLDKMFERERERERKRDQNQILRTQKNHSTWVLLFIGSCHHG
jgi:hypothetical protein